MAFYKTWPCPGEGRSSLARRLAARGSRQCGEARTAVQHNSSETTGKPPAHRHKCPYKGLCLLSALCEPGLLQNKLWAVCGSSGLESRCDTCWTAGSLRQSEVTVFTQSHPSKKPLLLLTTIGFYIETNNLSFVSGQWRLSSAP